MNKLNFTTLFNANYLSRGLILYESLEKYCTDFHLYIFAFDQLSYNILKEYNLKHATIISLRDFENEKLLQVKPSRSLAEYCWTCTPSTIHYVLSNFSVDNCTYLDSDLVFYHSPRILINELPEGKNIIITEHKYSKYSNLYEQNRGGKFVVQFVTFTNAPDSMNVLETWLDQCLEWCYARYEDGKFGDQKYLDVWPEKYSNVHILNHLGGGLAPWNVMNYRFKNIQEKIAYDPKTKSEFQMVFYHFHYVHVMDDNTVDIGWHFIPNAVKQNLYIPYIHRLLRIEAQLTQKYSEFRPLRYKTDSKGLKNKLKQLLKKITQYNIVKS